MSDDGMKAGSADDPWEDDDTTDNDPEPVETEPDQTATTAETSAASREQESRPYLDRRENAKTNRRLVQFFLRDEVFSELDENQLQNDVHRQLGEQPGKFDLREALVAVAQDHPSEVVDELREMGY